MTNVLDLETILRNNPDLAVLLDRFAEIALPDAWLDVTNQALFHQWPGLTIIPWSA